MKPYSSPIKWTYSLIILIFLFFGTEDVSATNRMTSIPNEVSLTGTEAKEHTDQLAFMQWLVQHPAITDEQFEALSQFFESPSTQVSASARSLMVAHKLIDYQEPYLVPDLTKSVEVKKPKAEAAGKLKEVIRVYPNPGKDFVTLEYSLGDNFNSNSYEVSDQTGKIVKKGSLGKSADQVIIDTRDLATGNYYINLISGSKNVTGARFVIAK